MLIGYRLRKQNGSIFTRHVHDKFRHSGLDKGTIIIRTTGNTETTLKGGYSLFAFVDLADFFIERTAQKNLMTNMHYHSSYELYYLEAGSREYCVEDKLFVVETGSFVLIPPYRYHRTQGEFALRVVVNFTKEFLLKFFNQQTVSNLLDVFKQPLISPSDDITQRNCKILINSMIDCENDLECSIQLASLLLLLSKSSACDTPKSSIANVIEYIKQNFANINSIDEIAEASHFSKHHLCRLFKKNMDVTVMDYLNTIKIRNACNYLEATDKRILEISQLCGFNSPAYFSKVFKDQLKLSPSEYRKQFSNVNH